MIVQEGNLTIITPDKGFKFITNGEVTTDYLILGKNDSADNWTNTNVEIEVAEE